MIEDHEIPHGYKEISAQREPPEGVRFWDLLCAAEPASPVLRYIEGGKVKDHSPKQIPPFLCGKRRDQPSLAAAEKEYGIGTDEIQMGKSIYDGQKIVLFGEQECTEPPQKSKLYATAPLCAKKSHSRSKSV